MYGLGVTVKDGKISAEIDYKTISPESENFLIASNKLDDSFSLCSKSIIIS